MEMPVLCKCGEWVELNDCKTSELTGELLCPTCCDVEDTVYRLKEEIIDIQLDLDNDAESMKGNRRYWKQEIKDKKEQIKQLGFNFEDYI